MHYVLPILIAMFVSNLVVILNYAGIIGLFIAFFFLISLHLRSQWVCRQTFWFILDKNKMNAYGYNSTYSSNENSPLLGAQQSTNKKPTFAVDLIEFLFTTRNSVLYKTPYSMFFSYPIVVLGIALISFMTLVFTIFSLIA